MNACENDTCYANISKIVSYFRRTSQSGFLFCACNNQAYVKQLNQQIIERAKTHGLNIVEAYISYDNRDKFLDKLREAAILHLQSLSEAKKGVKPDGIIVNNLDELIFRSEGDFLREINFSREILIEIGISLLFWLTEENITKFANKAPDFFIRRDRSVIRFAEPTGHTQMQRMEDFYALGFKGTQKYEELKITIEILERQLKDAKAREYSEERIAKEVAADLIKAYLDASLHQEAFDLFENYKRYYEENENIKFINLSAAIYKSIGEFDRSLKCLLKSEYISYNVGNIKDLGLIYNNIAFIYSKIGEKDKSLDYYLKSEKINLESESKYGLGAIYNNIGLYYSDKKMWDKSLFYYLKAETICKKIGDNVGLVFIYNNIGFLYEKKGEENRAIEYYLKSEKSCLYIGDFKGLIYTYFNYGILLKNKNSDVANNYLILAGYIAKTLGMKHEFSKREWALTPIINELGEEKFMEIGKQLYEEKLAEAADQKKNS